MAEPHLPEKQEADDVLIQYFKDFLSDGKNTVILALLRVAEMSLRWGTGKTTAMFVRVTGANANRFASFKHATVDCELYKSESDSTIPVAVPFGAYFYNGYRLLKEFLHEESPKLPTNKNALLALKDLLEFFSSTKDMCALTQQKKTAEPESALAVRVAQHLLVPLAPHKTFVIDSYPGLQLNGCCVDDHPMAGIKGDTSFGCRKGWHGRSDILLMGDDIPLTVVDTEKNADIEKDAGDLEAVSVSSDSSIEVKKAEDFNLESMSQITAQTIVYSFVHNKKYPKSPNSLVPGIGICAKKLVINLYDCVEDILVTTGPVDLYKDSICSNLNDKAIVMLWFALNHGIFGNETPEEYRNYKAKFHDVVGSEYLKAYKNESEQPFMAKRHLSMFLSELHIDKIDGTGNLANQVYTKTPYSYFVLK